MYHHKSLYLSNAACKYKELPTHWFCQNRIYVPHTAHMWIPASSKTNPATRCSKCEPICQHQQGTLSFHSSGVSYMSATQESPVWANSATTWWLGSLVFPALFGKVVPKFLFLHIKMKAVFHVPGKWGRGSRQAATAYVHTQVKTGRVQDRPKNGPGLDTKHFLNEQ